MTTAHARNLRSGLLAALLISEWVFGVSTALAVGTATAQCGSSWWRRASGSGGDSEWGNTDGLGKGTNIWTDGTNHADAVVCGPTVTTEPKFPGGAANPAFTGFSRDCNAGVNGSYVLTTGQGESTIGLTHKVKVEVAAIGAKGTVAAEPYYEGNVVCNDPWELTAPSFVGLPGGFYDLYVPIEVEVTTSVTELDELSDFEFRVAYEAENVTFELLKIKSQGQNDVVVSGGASSGVSFFLMNDFEQPTTQPVDLKSLAQLQTILAQDYAADRIISPTSIGIFLDNLPIPALDLGAGVLARIHIDNSASVRGGASPVPSVPAMNGYGLMALIAVGALGIALLHRRQAGVGSS